MEEEETRHEEEEELLLSRTIPAPLWRKVSKWADTRRLPQVWRRRWITSVFTEGGGSPRSEFLETTVRYFSLRALGFNDTHSNHSFLPLKLLELLLPLNIPADTPTHHTTCKCLNIKVIYICEKLWTLMCTLCDRSFLLDLCLRSPSHTVMETSNSIKW